MKLVQTCETSIDCFMKDQINNISIETAIILVISLCGVLIVYRGLKRFKR